MERLLPSEWPASPEGIAAAERLATAPLLSPVEAVASSPAVKALATAEPIATRLGLKVMVEAELREVERPPSPIVPKDVIDGWVRAYVIEGGREGWESASAAKERITSCIGRVRAATTVR